MRWGNAVRHSQATDFVESGVVHLLGTTWTAEKWGRAAFIKMERTWVDEGRGRCAARPFIFAGRKAAQRRSLACDFAGEVLGRLGKGAGSVDKLCGYVGTFFSCTMAN